MREVSPRPSPDSRTAEAFSISSLGQVREWVPGDFPQEPIRIGKVARITSPEHVLRLLHRGRADCDCEPENLIHQRLRADIMRQSQTGKAGAAGGHRLVICEAGARVKCAPCAFKFEHDAVLILDIIVSRKAEAITIEGERSGEISHS